MDIPLEPILLPYLAIIAVTMLVTGFIGLMRGWKAQLAILALMAFLWILFSLAGNTLVEFVNDMYRGVLFLTSCVMDADPCTCFETSGLAQKTLIDPNNPNQVRLFFTVILASAAVLAYLFVMRLGRRPPKISQKLLGALMGVATGFILSYLLLSPMLQQLPIPLPEAWTAEGFPQIPGLVAGAADVCQVSLPFGFMMFLVLFVIVAVRFIRAPKKEEA
jgi:hypothetical protein